ncbi:MAG TPA: GntR family transcriptional regulator [Candidatus Ozemobacteraceae bacterium]|mgnify:CR=1 FL=1|nr:GntR family transcriptional regulator [Candidatus Ozemobacteraceae bacterium]
MFGEFAIEKGRGLPAYRQLIDKIRQLIRERKLLAGDRLPPERELARHLGLARGTVKKAYEELSRERALTITQGSGTFVAAQVDPAPPRQSKAQQLVQNLVDELESLRYPPEEIERLLTAELDRRTKRRAAFPIAAVDCNPEALAIFEQQLGRFAHLKLHTILLDELRQEIDAAGRLAPFALIITTPTHQAEMLDLAPGIADRLLPVAVAPSPETVLALAGLAGAGRIAVLCRSERFHEIIRIHLKRLGIAPERVTAGIDIQPGALPKLLQKAEAIIIPPGHAFSLSRRASEALSEFRSRGGALIRFEYQIERGSILHIEERVAAMLQRPPA